MRVVRGFAAASFLSLVAIAPAWGETLIGALQYAYSHNATLNAQRAATRAADEQLPQALSGYRPTITLTADAGFNRTRTQTFLNSRTQPVVGPNGSIGLATIPGGSATIRQGTNPYGIGITIEQTLFDGFRTVNGVKAARAAIAASHQTLMNVEQNTLLGAAQAYANVVFARSLVRLRQRNIAFLSEQSRSSNARLQVGESTKTDLAQSNARLALGRAQLSAAQADLAAAEGNYRRIVGRDPGQLRKPAEPRHLYPQTLEQAVNLGISRHPAIQATQSLVDFAQFNVKVSEGAFLPSISATASLNQRFNTSDNRTDTQSAEAGIRFSMPLYLGGRASSQVRQQKQRLSENRIRVDETRDQVRAEVITAWTQLETARANLAANRAQVQAAKLALAGVIEERNVGQRTQLDVLNEQSRVLQAEELLLQAEQLGITAGYRLVAATGRLTSRQIGLRVDHYDPQEHLDVIKDKWFGLRTPSGQ